MKKFFDKIKEWFLALDQRYYIAFIAGSILAAFIALVIPSFAEWSVVPVIAILVVVDFIRNWKGKPFHWKIDLAALLGAAVIWAFQLIR